jgi:hypothetical protein
MGPGGNGSLLRSDMEGKVVELIMGGDEWMSGKDMLSVVYVSYGESLLGIYACAGVFRVECSVSSGHNLMP